MSAEILATHLQSTEVALAQEQPDLQHHIQRVFRTGKTEQKPLTLGDITARTYRVEMRKEDAKAVLEALTAAEKKFGWKHKFAGYQINLLVQLWKHIVHTLQSQQQ
jgi:hypothetical protein